MAKTKTGRPTKKEGDSETDHVRVNQDIKDMLSDLLLLFPKWKTAQILDPLIRPELTRLWQKHKPQIDAAKAAEIAAEEALEKIRIEAARLADSKAASPARRPKSGQ